MTPAAGSSRPRAVLVTGATSGIGFATATELARRGAQVVLHGRSLSSAQAAASEIRKALPEAQIDTCWADLGSLPQVRELARQLLERAHLDVVIHNAGLERFTRQLTDEGLELTFAVNHLAPFLLTRLLEPLLARSAPARVIFVSSMVHAWGTMHWDDLSAEHWYSPEPVYQQSKLAAALCAQAFASRLQARRISVLLAPPGLTRTRFTRDFSGFPAMWSRLVGRWFFRTPESVAREFAEIALSPDFEGTTGKYIDRLHVRLPAEKAMVREDQIRLWKISSQLVGLPET